MFERLSDESRHGRFLVPKPVLTPADLAYLSDVDGHDHEALVCVDRESGQPLGIARFIRLREIPRSPRRPWPSSTRLRGVGSARR